MKLANEISSSLVILILFIIVNLTVLNNQHTIAQLNITERINNNNFVKFLTTTSNELCNKYLETCDTNDEKYAEEEFRNKYLEPDDNDNNNTTTPSTTTASNAVERVIQNDTNQTQEGGFQRYENPALGITIQYPSDWQITERPNNTGLIARMNVSNVVSFFSPLKDSGLRIGEIMPSAQGQANISFLDNKSMNVLSTQYTSFQLITTNTTAVVGHNIPATKVVFMHDSSSSAEEQELQKEQFAPLGKRLFGMLVFTMKDGRTYVIEAYSEILQGAEAQQKKYSNSLVTTQKMVDTFGTL
jgi:hypothetical protein